MPAGYAVSAWTVVGGATLGLGAWVNKACVFGAVARLGSGEWAYSATPVGYFVGCLSVMPLFSGPMAVALSDPSPLFRVPTLCAVTFMAFALWRMRPGLAALRGPAPGARLSQTIWAPHTATIVIGVSFVITLLLAGRWAYTDVLADLARAQAGRTAHLGLPVLLLMALYAGALIGGRTAGRWRSTPVDLGRLLRCFAGGVLMAWGSLLIPGSNDGLILIGLPLLRPYAWLAFASMFATIAIAIHVERLWRSRARLRRGVPLSG
jgi:toxin CptA